MPGRLPFPPSPGRPEMSLEYGRGSHALRLHLGDRAVPIATVKLVGTVLHVTLAEESQSPAARDAIRRVKESAAAWAEERGYAIGTGTNAPVRPGDGRDARTADLA
ncbi:MAG: hypothetical protein ACRD12_11785, partial [Acidimicrobiales bacterium]